jgi:hypothetical protein
MGFGRKVDHPGNGIAGKEALDQLPVGHVPVDKSIMGIALKTDEVLGITGVSQEVQVENVPVRLLLPQIVEEIGTDKSGSSGYQHITHKRSS